MLLEELKEVLNKNQNLSDEIKKDFLSLCEIIINKFPNIKIDNLKRNLENLKVERVSKYVSDDYAYYNGIKNTLYINYSKITDDDDVKHIMMHQLLNILTFNGSFSGFNENNFLKALNVGFTEMLTNNLVGNEGEVSYYEDELIATNLLANIVDFDTLCHAYFGNDSRLVLNSIVGVGRDR